MSRQIDRRRDLSLQEFLDGYAVPGIPVIIEDDPEVKAWKATRLWTREFFAENYSQVPVTLYRTGAPHRSRQATLGEFLQTLDQPARHRPLYLKHWAASPSPRILSRPPTSKMCYRFCNTPTLKTSRRSKLLCWAKSSRGVRLEG